MYGSVRFVLFGFFRSIIGLSANLARGFGFHKEIAMKWHRIFAGLYALLFSAVASAALITPNDLFVWVEKDFPSIFPKGPVTQVIPFGGCTYEARYYNTNGGVYIGVCRTNERVYTYNVVGTGLADHGPLDGYKCQARPDLCGAAGYAGNILFADDGTT
ncbi:MAG: hypothetical protein KBA91_01925, partial [Candidatus Moranbacteria bacterium]|nr:hypothetical protein [Candidatus Moranbacteria bacterium]